MLYVMSLFDVILVQPIFNVLVFIYGIIPGHDFGVALILFTILVRLVMWPLVRKQLHQTKAMQKIQGEVKKIKARAGGDRQLEAQLTMELYRERGVNPFGSIGLLIVQLPVFIALFAVVRLITSGHGSIAKYTYHFLSFIPQVKAMLANPSVFHDTLFGVVDLTRQALGTHPYVPALVMAVGAAALQFVQSRQLLPKVEAGRKLRDVLREQAAGKQVDQSEVSALMTRRMSLLFPALTFLISTYLAGALVLYLLVTSAVAVWQQQRVLSQDTEELEEMADKKTLATAREAAAAEAEVVAQPIKPKPATKKHKRRKK